jgi:DNA-binding MarR family transcriptional regulator
MDQAPIPLHNPFEHWPGYLLHRAARFRLARLHARLVPLGLSVLEASVLVLIGQNPGLSQVACGRMLAVQRANMNPLVHRLVHGGWVLVGQAQGRRRGLALTAAGQALAMRLEQAFAEQEAWIMAAVPEAFREAVMPVLRALYRLEEEETPALG